MNRMKIKKIVALLLLGLLVFTGCRSRQTVVLQSSGAGRLDGEVVLHPVLQTYLSDLALAMGGENASFFDLPTIERSFRENPAVTLVSLANPSPDTLTFSLKWDDINASFRDIPVEGKNLITFTPRSDGGTLEIEINKENFSQISAYFPVMNEDIMAYFIPNGEISRQDYLEELGYAFEDYLEGITIETVLENSSIEIAIAYPGELVSQQGGRQQGEQVVFSLPFLDVLVLSEPVRFSLTFKS